MKFEESLKICGSNDYYIIIMALRILWFDDFEEMILRFW